MSEFITDPATLQDCIGRLPGPRDLKVIDFLDNHAIRWLSYASLGFMACSCGAAIAITAAGGDAGFIRVDDARRISFAMDALDDPSLACEGAGFGSLLLVPAWGRPCASTVASRQ